MYINLYYKKIGVLYSKPCGFRHFGSCLTDLTDTLLIQDANKSV